MSDTYVPPDSPTDPEAAADCAPELDAFDRVIATGFLTVMAGWDDPVRCEVTRRGVACVHPAAWRVNVHGCIARLMCTGHKEDLMQRAVAAFRHPDDWHRRCDLCRQTFVSVEAAYTVSAL